jgi:DNA-binding beta-propeller fold protein YncE
MLKNNNKIRKLMLATGEVTSLAGGAQGSADGIGGAASFYMPFSVDISPDDTYALIADSANSLIRKIIIESGMVTTLAGGGPPGTGGEDGIGSAASFYSPWGVAISTDGTFALVSDSLNNKIRKVVTTAAGTAAVIGTVTTLAGGGDGASTDSNEGSEASFNEPPWAQHLGG